MPKKRELKMWALWNYATLFTVQNRRKDCREYAEEISVGGKEKSDEMFKVGSFRIGKVIVREI